MFLKNRLSLDKKVKTWSIQKKAFGSNQMCRHLKCLKMHQLSSLWLAPVLPSAYDEYRRKTLTHRNIPEAMRSVLMSVATAVTQLGKPLSWTPWAFFINSTGFLLDVCQRPIELK